MKRENVKKLLNEMAEREFNIEELAEVFYTMACYLQEVKFRAEDPAGINHEHLVAFNFWKGTMERAIDIYGLDFSLEEIAEPF